MILSRFIQAGAVLASVSVLALTSCAPTPPQVIEPPALAAGQRISLEHKIGGMRGALSYKLVYRTQDALDPHQLRAASAVVLIPEGRKPVGGWPVMVWDHGTTGMNMVCAPSVQGMGPPQRAFMAAWLKAGFAVVAPDYPGMGEPGPDLWLNARAEGMATLDAARAALSSMTELRNDLVIDGHSQGAQAAIAATGMAPAYAPDLHIRGTVAVAAPYIDDAEAAVWFRRGVTHFTPGVVYGLLLGASVASVDPSFSVSGAFTPRAAPYVAKAGQQCIGDFFGSVQHAGLTPANSFTPDTAQALSTGLEWAKYPTLHLSTPVFQAIGTGDRQINPALQHRLTHDLCAAGTQVSLRVYPGVDHIPLVGHSERDAIGFARAVLDGAPVRSSCPAP